MQVNKVLTTFGHEDRNHRSKRAVWCVVFCQTYCSTGNVTNLNGRGEATVINNNFNLNFVSLK